MTAAQIYKTIWALIIFAFVYTAYFMLTNGEPGSLTWWPLAVAFYGWACLPFMFVASRIQKHRNQIPYLFVVLVTTVILSLGGLVLLYQAFVTNLDPQSGLAFLFLPAYELIAAAIGLALASITQAAIRKA